MERYRTERRYAANVEEIMAREEARARMAQRRARQGKPAPADEEPTAAQAELWAHINARFQALADAAEKLAMSLDVLDGRPLTDDTYADLVAEVGEERAASMLRDNLMALDPGGPSSRELLEVLHRYHEMDADGTFPPRCGRDDCHHDHRPLAEWLALLPAFVEEQARILNIPE
jgi:hypothetical protein